MKSTKLLSVRYLILLTLGSANLFLFQNCSNYTGQVSLSDPKALRANKNLEIIAENSPALVQVGTEIAMDPASNSMPEQPVLIQVDPPAVDQSAPPVSNEIPMATNTVPGSSASGSGVGSSESSSTESSSSMGSSDSNGSGTSTQSSTSTESSTTSTVVNETAPTSSTGAIGEQSSSSTSTNTGTVAETPTSNTNMGTVTQLPPSSTQTGAVGEQSGSTTTVVDGSSDGDHHAKKDDDHDGDHHAKKDDDHDGDHHAKKDDDHDGDHHAKKDDDHDGDHHAKKDDDHDGDHHAKKDDDHDEDHHAKKDDDHDGDHHAKKDDDHDDSKSTLPVVNPTITQSVAQSAQTMKLNGLCAIAAAAAKLLKIQTIVLNENAMGKNVTIPSGRVIIISSAKTTLNLNYLEVGGSSIVCGDIVANTMKANGNATLIYVRVHNGEVSGKLMTSTLTTKAVEFRVDEKSGKDVKSCEVGEDMKIVSRSR